MLAIGHKALSEKPEQFQDHHVVLTQERIRAT